MIKINYSIPVVFKYLRSHHRGISLFWVTVEGRNKVNLKKIKRDSWTRYYKLFYQFELFISG